MRRCRLIVVDDICELGFIDIGMEQRMVESTVFRVRVPEWSPF
jgi:hypothetical protein